MEQSRPERGGELKLVVSAAGILALAAFVESVVLLTSRNKRTPQLAGGWTLIDFDDLETSIL